MKFYDCSYCGAIGHIPPCGKPAVPAEGHINRPDGTLTCPRAVDRGLIDDLFRQLYEEQR